MLISVLVPVYGVERYIERCAVSLFEQTYSDIEYIFVDDCSPDRSVSILRSVMERYPVRKSQVRILRNDRNRGLGYTRAVAVNESRGSYVMHVDSDDYIPLSAVEHLARCAEATEADIVDGAYCEARSDGLSEVVKAPPASDESGFLVRMLCQDFVPSHVWARLIRRSLYTENGINAVEGVDYSEDFSVMPRLMYYARRAVIDDVVYYYNVENLSSYTHGMTEKHMVSLARANSIVYDFFMNECQDRRFRAAAQVGLLNMMRSAKRNGFSFSLVDRHCRHRLQGLPFRVLGGLMRSRCPFQLVNVLFLLLRRAVAHSPKR